jgi:hypothetical protein
MAEYAFLQVLVDFMPWMLDVGCWMFGVEFTYALSIRDIVFGGGWS